MTISNDGKAADQLDAALRAAVEGPPKKRSDTSAAEHVDAGGGWKKRGFSNLDREMLRIVAAEQPVGARRIAQVLWRELGWHLSESTVTRRLEVLDRRNLTTNTRNRGRSVTPQGLGIVAAAADGRRRLATIERALAVESVKELEDWLRARRAVEGEAAYLAALRRTNADLQVLEETHAGILTEFGEPQRPDESDIRADGLRFHRVLCALSQNSILIALADLLFDSRLEPLEEVLNLITGSRGSRDEALFEHAAILDHIAQQNADAARAATEAHVTNMIDLVSEFARTAGESLITGVMRLAVAAASFGSDAGCKETHAEVLRELQ